MGLHITDIGVASGVENETTIFLAVMVSLRIARKKIHCSSGHSIRMTSLYSIPVDSPPYIVPRDIV